MCIDVIELHLKVYKLFKNSFISFFVCELAIDNRKQQQQQEEKKGQL